jgi:hypothetical protein
VESKQGLIGHQLRVESGVMAVIDDGGVVGINYGVTAAGQPLTTSHPPPPHSPQPADNALCGN